MQKLPLLRRETPITPCIQVVIIIFGGVVTYSTDIENCTAGVYNFASVTIGMALVSMMMFFMLVGKVCCQPKSYKI